MEQSRKVHECTWNKVITRPIKKMLFLTHFTSHTVQYQEFVTRKLTEDFTEFNSQWMPRDGLPRVSMHVRFAHFEVINGHIGKDVVRPYLRHQGPQTCASLVPEYIRMISGIVRKRYLDNNGIATALRYCTSSDYLQYMASGIILGGPSKPSQLNRN